MWARTSARAYNRPIIQPASQPTFASIGLPPWPRSAKKQSARNYEGRLRDVRRAARATNLLGYSFGDDHLAALRLQVRVGKPQNLKTAGITDDPEIQLAPFPVSGRNFDKARQTRLLLDGSIDARRPTAGSGKKGLSRRRPLPVRDLRGVEGIANVVNARA